MKKKKDPMAEKTKKVLCVIPITGVMSVDIEVPEDMDEDEMFLVACEMWSTNGSQCDLEWEFCEHVVQGNVSHAMQNRADFRVLGRGRVS